MAISDEKLLRELDEQFGFPIEANSHLFLEAFTHSSFKNENNLDYDNERLEFLGDAILEHLVAEYLFKQFPEAREGRLSKIKSSVVNTVSLSRIAEKLNFGRLLRLGQGEEKASRGLEKEQADVVEAFTAAVYLATGLQQIREFIMPYLVKEVDRYLAEGSKNYKGRLLEAAQKVVGQHPTYRVESVSGPEHDPHYSVSTSIDGEVYGHGEGKNKKEAEQSAAREALKKFDVNES